VLYYVSPQIWAWRKNRVKQIARWVDRMAVIFPFEKDFYEQHGVRVSFVGHPLLGIVKANAGRMETLTKLGLDPSRPVIALLPGSRRAEVTRHLPVMAEAALALSRERKAQFFCVRAATIKSAELRSWLDQAGVRMPIVEDDRYGAIQACDVAWTASGTATVEIALLGRPMIIIYRLSWLTYLVARWLVQVDHVGMVNLIAGQRVMPELIQQDVNAERIAAETRILLDDAKTRARITDELSKLRERLGCPGAADRVAELALSMMG
jgi:lipid-A-disaccharide synthase